MELMAIFREFAQMAGPAAVRALWQGAVLTLALVIGLRFAPRVSAADRFRIWSAAFAVLVALPLLPLLGGFPFGSAGVATLASTFSSPPANRPLIDIDPRWSLAIAAVWLALSAWRALDLLAHSLRLRRLWKNAVRLEVAGLGYQVCSTRELDRPSVIGFFAPRILIPDWLLERLSPEELEQVILHEAEHLRRRDDWTNLLQKLLLVIFPVNPALVWVERRLCREREMACDEGVVRRTQAPRAYAACLASLAERGLQRRSEALSLGAWQRRPELVERVHRILRRSPALHPAAARALVIVVGCGLVAASVELARCPQLLGFAATPRQAMLAQAGEADAVINPGAVAVAGRMLTAARVGEGFHAMNAIALMPSRAPLAATRASNNHAAAGPRTATASIRGTRPEAARRIATAERHALPVAARQMPQQWVLFTTWEQIETTTRPARQAEPARAFAAAAGSSSPETTGSQADAVIPATRRFTVTRFYLTIYGAGAARLAPGAKQSLTPAAQQLFPLHDGWLVIQL